MTEEVAATERTFCGDLDVETGDCDLMFLAEEPADNRVRETEEKRNSN